MAPRNTEWTCVPLSDAINFDRLDSHTYRVNLNENYCIGAVPNGGYVGSCMLAAASAYLCERDQPDALTAHFEYPARTSPGPAVIVIEDVKLGRSLLSTVHLTLWQGGLKPQAPWITPSVSHRVVLAYATYTNLRTFSGISMPTGYESSPAAALPEPLPDFGALKTSAGDNAWEEAKLLPGPASGLLNSLRNWHFYLPRGHPQTPGVLDMWVRAASGERITQAALPYVADSFPINLHAYLAAPELRELLLAPPSRKRGRRDASDGRGGEEEEDRDGEGQVEARQSLWFPTVVMNLEVKTALPEDGVEWLAVRVTSKQIRDGRFDLEVQVRDAEGEMVVLSHQIALIMSMERNTAKRASSTKASL